MKRYISLLIAGTMAVSASAQKTYIIKPLNLRDVQVNDAFWSPKLKVWHTVTAYDVFDKLEGKYEPDREDIIKEKKETGRTRDAFLNFDRVAQGKTNIGTSDGPPWYDGLVYETIRGAADLLVAYPDKKLEQKMDGYIDRIAAAQAADKEGYINTYTTLNRPNQRWGTNGGDDRWQHDMYNAGMLVEAGVHYYQATGKTKLLTVAVKMANYMSKVMGDAPKMNVIPGHAGPEEAFFKMYLLFKNNPALQKQVSAPVKADDYFALAKYWVEKRGVFADADGSRKRETFGAYNQDDKPVFDQQTIEGHAVRATLLGTAIVAMAEHTNDARYISVANRYWDNMAGKRTFITGGQGAIANDEKFGDDYFLPESAYLETCASIGGAFFSQRMNELQADGKYMDLFERALYNNILSGLSLDGTHYHYENPLVADKHPRWVWHSCPCCPPMLLKMAGALPGFIYAQDDKDVYVNLFIGSRAKLKLNNKNISIKQTTAYPWKGRVELTVDPASAQNFAVRIRVPGWAQGNENPYGLYTSATKGKVTLKVNGKDEPLNIDKGYAVIKRQWKKGDRIELNLPVEPRLVEPNQQVKTLENKLAIAAGPLVYGLEGNDNADVKNISITKEILLQEVNKPQLLGGVNVIEAWGADNKTQFTAIPFFALGNRGDHAYRVWLTESRQGK
ncbi:glycoside hydrolase family 127 protein [Mucilaginibacter sp. JRF]|uniref:glycoside hydrolase family 127 protein n=1 Tax=Mucilaginibacter sp. JRF TaxID=2780088 RepID=UPI00187E643E|nr:beta-L-arabinofuranosidase domain-containing protein [Mucilaginibacter sp. JRF]MBE9583121.1 glycoside hydrolase family 127 protein [Mucilaginibacter sp. JRF]